MDTLNLSGADLCLLVRALNSHGKSAKSDSEKDKCMEMMARINNWIETLAEIDRHII